MMHVNNAVYYMYFDTAQTTFYIQNGLLDMRQTSPYVVAESGCRHFSEVSYPDLLTVGIRRTRGRFSRGFPRRCLGGRDDARP